MSSKSIDKNRQKRIAKKKVAKKKKTARKINPNLPLVQGGSDTPAVPFRTAMEGVMNQFLGGATNDADDEAQDLMYQAWGSRTRRDRLSFARQALEISPNCADAYVLLAQDAAKSLDDAIDYYRQGMEAGARRIGEQAFVDDVGHFWGLLETRPYMRARAGLAECLWKAGQKEDAIAHYLDMLRLNPGDNQGLRYILLTALIENGRDKEAADLHKQYEDDGMAAWRYGAALLHFRREGDSATARRALDDALNGNPHVPTFLLGKTKVPARLPDYTGFGDESEAAVYTAENMAGWKKTDGAIDWLRSNV